MRVIAVMAWAFASCPGSVQDPCAGVVPKSLPTAVDLSNAPSDREPFARPYIGDARGFIAFVSAYTSNPINDFAAFIYDNHGRLVQNFEGQIAEPEHPHAVP